MGRRLTLSLINELYTPSYLITFFYKNMIRTVQLVPNWVREIFCIRNIRDYMREAKWMIESKQNYLLLKNVDSIYLHTLYCRKVAGLEHNYSPILSRSNAFLEKYNYGEDVKEFINMGLDEIAMYEKYQQYYSYVFYIGKKKEVDCMPSKQNNFSFTHRNDEELQKLIVGELKPHNAPIILVEYDPHWPKAFEREANRVRSILGDKIIQVEHVGSTSVPGLCAKPIIDMLLVVEDSADEPSYVPALEAAGYTLRIREPEWFEHRMFKGPDIDINLHVFGSGTSEIDRMLRFRDWLRSNETDRNKYAQVKRDLAKNKWRHIQNYADAKTSIVQEIMERANAIK